MKQKRRYPRQFQQAFLKNKAKSEKRRLDQTLEVLDRNEKLPIFDASSFTNTFNSHTVDFSKIEFQVLEGLLSKLYEVSKTEIPKSIP